MTIEELELKVKADIQKAISELRNIKAEVKDTAKQIPKLEESFDSMAKSVVANAGRMAAAFAIGTAFKKSFDYINYMEQQLVSLTVKLGDATAAQQLFQDMRVFAAKTPLELGEISQAANMLMSYGSKAEDLISTMTQLGDIASGVGAGLKDVAYLYGTLQTQGRVYMMDIRQFAGRGIPIYEELSKILKVSRSEINAMVSAGKVGFEDIKQAFANMTGEGGKFGNMMEKQSETVKGRMSTLSDVLHETGAYIFTPLVESLKTTIEEITIFLDTNKDAFLVFGEVVGWTLGTIIESITTLVSWLNMIPGPIMNVIIAIMPLALAFAFLPAVLNKINALMGMMTALKTAVLGATVAENAHGMAATATAIALKLKSIGMGMVNAVTAIYTIATQGAAAATMTLGAAIKALMGPIAIIIAIIAVVVTVIKKLILAQEEAGKVTIDTTNGIKDQTKSLEDLRKAADKTTKSMLAWASANGLPGIEKGFDSMVEFADRQIAYLEALKKKQDEFVAGSREMTASVTKGIKTMSFRGPTESFLVWYDSIKKTGVELNLTKEHMDQIKNSSEVAIDALISKTKTVTGNYEEWAKIMALLNAEGAKTINMPSIFGTAEELKLKSYTKALETLMKKLSELEGDYLKKIYDQRGWSIMSLELEREAALKNIDTKAKEIEAADTLTRKAKALANEYFDLRKKRIIEERQDKLTEIMDVYTREAGLEGDIQDLEKERIATLTEAKDLMKKLDYSTEARSKAIALIEAGFVKKRIGLEEDFFNAQRKFQADLTATKTDNIKLEYEERIKDAEKLKLSEDQLAKIRLDYEKQLAKARIDDSVREKAAAAELTMSQVDDLEVEREIKIRTMELEKAGSEEIAKMRLKYEDEIGMARINEMYKVAEEDASYTKSKLDDMDVEWEKQKAILEFKKVSEAEILEHQKAWEHERQMLMMQEYLDKMKLEEELYKKKVEYEYALAQKSGDVGGMAEGAAKQSLEGTDIGQLMAGANPIAMIAEAAMEFLMSIENINKTVNFLGTIFEGIAFVLGPVLNEAFEPLVIILQRIGEVIGNALAPFVEILATIFYSLGRVLMPILNIINAISKPLAGIWRMVHMLNPTFMVLTIATNAVGEAFKWLYNKVFMPVGNFIIDIMNSIATALNNLLGWTGFHINLMSRMKAMSTDLGGLEMREMQDKIDSVSEALTDLGEVYNQQKKEIESLHSQQISALQELYDVGAFTAAEYQSNVNKVNTEYQRNLDNLESAYEKEEAILQGILDRLNEGINVNNIEIDKATQSSMPEISDLKTRQMELLHDFLESKGLSTGSYASGTGKLTSDQIAQLHKGEMVVPSSFADSIRKGELTLGKKEGGTIYHVVVNVKGSVMTEDKLVDAIYKGIKRKQNRGILSA